MLVWSDLLNLALPVSKAQSPSASNMATERTPLVSDVDSDDSSVQYAGADGQTQPVSGKKQTPLPKMQVFALFLAQFCEPVTGTVIYPFVVSLVNETGTIP